ncbi:hypothetical protein M8C21_031822, partial [Ambrosia artemisiifolia]
MSFAPKNEHEDQVQFALERGIPAISAVMGTQRLPFPSIISSIAFSPSHTGMLATGSYSQTTAIYREDNMEQLYVLHGQEGGVTHVQFSKDGNYLYTRGRKCPCQSGITECGFYVMKFMKEIVQGGVEILGN